MRRAAPRWVRPGSARAALLAAWIIASAMIATVQCQFVLLSCCTTAMNIDPLLEWNEIHLFAGLMIRQGRAWVITIDCVIADKPEGDKSWAECQAERSPMGTAVLPVWNLSLTSPSLVLKIFVKPLEGFFGWR